MSSIYIPNITEMLPIGGKGENLQELESLVSVPNWIALPSTCFETFLTDTNLEASINTVLDTLFETNIASTSEVIETLITQTPFPETLKVELESAFSTNLSSSVSVRSSSVDEDGMNHSFAGMHESFLWVDGIDSICESIKKVWASGYTERVLLYRIKNELPLHPVSMGVIIQEMVESQSSGVVFTADPTSGNPHETVVSSLFGLGEGLVSQGLESDHFNVNKNSKEIEHTSAIKEFQVVRDKSGNGVCQVKLDKDLTLMESLSDEQVSELVETSRIIENHYRKPQDIEFAFDPKGKLFILQTRAITTAPEYGPAAGNRQVWDNSNIIESYSGVTTPMTFSFIRNAYAVVYTCFSEVMGISSKVIDENQMAYRNMLGLFRGQVYYNLINWYRLVKQFPGYNYNKSYMESMMGVKFKDDTNVETKPSGFWKRTFVDLPDLLKLIASLLTKFMGLKKSVPQFNDHFDKHYSVWAKMDFTTMAPYELMKVYREMEEKLLRNWKVPIINDFYVMVFYGTLKKLCTNWCGDDNGALQNNLICGEGDIASTEPTRLLMASARKIKAGEYLNKQFSTLSHYDLLERSKSDPQFETVKNAVQNYLDLYGFRCMNELKLEEPSLHETPEFVYQMLANYVAMKDEQLDPTLMNKREQKIRTDAEAQAFGSVQVLKRPLFKWVLKHARTGVKNRENLRFARTKIYGTLRNLLNSIGEEFVRENIIDDSQDIYYLAIDELWDFVGGTAVTTDLRSLISVRRNEFDHFRESPEQDEHFETYGTTYVKNLFKNYAINEEEDVDYDGIKGVPCSPGTIRGIARIISSPRDDVKLNGEILVASRTDPGWVPLYPSVSGILIERGSILSHSAIVAREMGIPAIVGIPNLLEKINDGDEIEIDGGSGIVTVVGEKLL